MLTKVKGFLAWPAKVHQILCSPKSQDFRHGPLRYASLFFIPFVFPYLMYAMYVVDIIFICYIKLYTSCAPVLIPNYCRLRVCVNVYRFSEGFISIAPIAMAMGIFFDCPICADIFFLILELQNLVL